MDDLVLVDFSERPGGGNRDMEHIDDIAELVSEGLFKRLALNPFHN